jgi:hypothetical protein
VKSGAISPTFGFMGEASPHPAGKSTTVIGQPKGYPKKSGRSYFQPWAFSATFKIV